MSARRYIAVVQAAEGYPPPGAPLEEAQPEGPTPPMIHSVVLADEYDAVESEVGRLREALEQTRAHIRSVLTVPLDIDVEGELRDALTVGPSS